MTLYHRTLLVVGHPRTGTAYTATLLRQLGLDVQHESGGADGISSWMMAVDDQQNPWAHNAIAASRSNLVWDLCLHPVRDFTAAMPSIIREDRHAPLSYEFRRRHILRLCGFDLDSCNSELERAAQSLLHWTHIIQGTQPDFWFRIEDGAQSMRNFLLSRGLIGTAARSSLDTGPVNADKAYKGKRYPKPTLTEEDWARLPGQVKNGILKYCSNFSYATPPFGQTRKPDFSVRLMPDIKTKMP